MKSPILSPLGGIEGSVAASVQKVETKLNCRIMVYCFWGCTSSASLDGQFLRPGEFHPQDQSSEDIVRVCKIKDKKAMKKITQASLQNRKLKCSKSMKFLCAHGFKDNFWSSPQTILQCNQIFYVSTIFLKDFCCLRGFLGQRCWGNVRARFRMSSITFLL